MKNRVIVLAALSILGSSVVLKAQDPSFRPAEEPRRQQTTAPATVLPDDASAAAGRISSMAALDDISPLAIGDRVSVRIVEDKDKVLSLLVQDSGDIQAPFIGLVRASGRTCKQVAFFMKKELEKQYFQSATVIVALESRPRKAKSQVDPDMNYITIYGQVARQGRYELAPDDDLTISQAVLRAGGFTQFAKTTKVKLIRKLPAGGHVNIIVNLEKVMTKGHLDEDIFVRPNDVVIVSEKLVNF